MKNLWELQPAPFSVEPNRTLRVQPADYCMAKPTTLILLLFPVFALPAAELKSTPLDLRQLPPVAAGPVDFVKDIQPLLAAKCHACHGLEKQKGGLRLDIKA
ncbi:MAG: hypothetical protein EB141_02890, partial [Verrucomicrobia bacterium]|nr:hypothetical protein [Verrucomicrobiota bacterium]